MASKINQFFTNHLVWRIFFAVVIPILFAGILIVVYNYKELIKCPFYSLTGFYCPGCGSGRAMMSLLHLEFISAVKYNVLAVLALPLVAYYYAGRYLAIVIGKDILPIFKTSVLACNIVLVLLLLFGILRNLPFFPFTLLAP